MGKRVLVDQKATTGRATGGARGTRTQELSEVVGMEIGKDWSGACGACGVGRVDACAPGPQGMSCTKKKPVQ